jgi:hypothetical protein
MTIRWPCHTLMPQNVAWDIAPRTLAAPSSVSGITQVVSSDAGIWKATYDAINIRNRTQILTFRAIAVQLEGRLGPIVVPRCSAWQPLSGQPIVAEVPHDDGAKHDDDAGYDGAISNWVELLSALPVRATIANVFIADGSGIIEPGQDFSIGERMYRVRTITYTTPDAATITFRPPLREAAPAGAFLNFDDPVCRMRLATDNAMDLELVLHRFGSPTVTFLEDV